MSGNMLSLTGVQAGQFLVNSGTF